MEMKLDFTARANLIKQLCDLDFWNTIDTYERADSTLYEFYSSHKGLTIIIEDGEPSRYNKVTFNWH